MTAPRCEGCACGPLPVIGARFAVIAHGQPGDPGALQPALESLAARVSARSLCWP